MESYQKRKDFLEEDYVKLNVNLLNDDVLEKTNMKNMLN